MLKVFVGLNEVIKKKKMQTTEINEVKQANKQKLSYLLLKLAESATGCYFLTYGKRTKLSTEVIK